MPCIHGLDLVVVLTPIRLIDRQTDRCRGDDRLLLECKNEGVVPAVIPTALLKLLFLL